MTENANNKIPMTRRTRSPLVVCGTVIVSSCGGPECHSQGVVCHGPRKEADRVGDPQGSQDEADEGERDGHPFRSRLLATLRDPAQKGLSEEAGEGHPDQDPYMESERFDGIQGKAEGEHEHVEARCEKKCSRMRVHVRPLPVQALARPLRRCDIFGSLFFAAHAKTLPTSDPLWPRLSPLRGSVGGFATVDTKPVGASIDREGP